VNYYGPRELQDGDGKGTGLWHYTVRNDDRIWPVGYCRDDCPGHQSADGARAHQRRYELDNLRHVTYRGWTDCEVCGAATKRAIEHGPGIGRDIALCDEHYNAETWEPLVVVGEVISS